SYTQPATMGDELRFAVCTFRRVFDAAPSQEVLNLEQLTAGLLRFALRPELQAKVEREHKKIAAAVKMWEQQSGSGRRYSALVRMSREAEQRGEDVATAVAAEAQHLRKLARGEAKNDLRLWSPTCYRGGARRGSDGVEHISCLVLDYDDGDTTIEVASATWERWYHIVHTTWSHRPEHPKFRVIVPLAEPVSASNWQRVWAWAEERTGMAIDPACKSVSHTYALPAVPNAGWPRVGYVRPGCLLDPRMDGLVDQTAAAPRVLRAGYLMLGDPEESTIAMFTPPRAPEPVREQHAVASEPGDALDWVDDALDSVF
ncbi:MAG: hypothetical protein ACPG77_05770, partial [Nannocystaceae bacterium]